MVYPNGLPLGFFGVSGFQEVAARIYICKQMQTLNVLNNSIVSKVHNCYFLVQSAHEEKRVNSLPLLNMKVTLLTSLFFYTVWLTVVKTLKSRCGQI